MKAINHTNLYDNCWAFYAEDVMVRIDALLAHEEHTMRECMSNRDNYDIEGIKSVIAYNDKNGWTFRANIARAILAERLTECDGKMHVSTKLDLQRSLRARTLKLKEVKELHPALATARTVEGAISIIWTL